MIPRMAITNVVTISTISKNNGLATEKKVLTLLTVEIKDDQRKAWSRRLRFPLFSHGFLAIIW
ncbi:unnamed protein product [Arabidopsis halleri]